jgi:hypothetical protein
LKPIRKVLFIFFCWLATILPARALAVSASPHSIVLCEQHQTVQLHPYTYFVDSSRWLAASDIAQRFAGGEFKGPSHKAMTFGYTDHRHWVEFNMRNDSTEGTWYVLPGHPLRGTVFRIFIQAAPPLPSV